jgi:hypothetical protein
LKNRFPHITALLFLGFLLLPLASLLLLQAVQQCLKTAADERMENQSLVTVSLPLGNVVWHKKDKELTIEGRLFDVKAYYVSNGLLTATGFFDDKETSVVQMLLHLTTQETNKALLQLVLVLQCFVTIILFFSLCRANSRLVHQTVYAFFLPAPDSFMVERPPKR